MRRQAQRRISCAIRRRGSAILSGSGSGTGTGGGGGIGRPLPRLRINAKGQAAIFKKTQNAALMMLAMNLNMSPSLELGWSRNMCPFIASDLNQIADIDLFFLVCFADCLGLARA
jgi:hypothetical protein